MPVVIVEGNISAGKSTLVKDLKPFCHAFLEPTISNPYLEKFYAEPKKYALPLQLWMLRQRFITYVAACRIVLKSDTIVLLDRSIFSDWVFAEKNRQDGNISEEGYQYYMSLRERLLEGLPAPSAAVYLDVPSQTCFDRVHGLRCRDCEVGIPLEYLAGLEECYKGMLSHMGEMGTKVISLDWDQFGNSRSVLNLINNACAEKAAQTPEEVANMQELLYNESALISRLEIDLSIPGTIDDAHTLSVADAESQAEEALQASSPERPTAQMAPTQMGTPPQAPTTIDEAGSVISPHRG